MLHLSGFKNLTGVIKNRTKYQRELWNVIRKFELNEPRFYFILGIE